MPSFLYCLNTSTLSPADLPTKILAASAAGFRAIELWHAEIDAWLAEGGRLESLARMLDDAGLAAPSLISLKGWADPDTAADPATWREIERRFAQAAALGAEICVAGPPLGPAPTSEVAAAYRRLLALGKKHGVRPALEFLGFAAELCTLEAALRIVEAAEDPAGCVVLDPFHLFRGGSGVEAFASAGLTARRIGILHFNDAPESPPREQQQDSDRVLPGAGRLPLGEYLAAARRAGYAGALSLELFPRPREAGDPFEVARRGLAAMRAVAEATEDGSAVREPP